jgi:hypothetical protein
LAALIIFVESPTGFNKEGILTGSNTFTIPLRIEESAESQYPVALFLKAMQSLPLLGVSQSLPQAPVL